MSDVQRKVSLITGVTYVTGVAVLLTAGMLAWFLFLDPITPLESTRLVKIDVHNPPGRNGYFVVSREFCFSRPSEAEVTRLFRRMTDGGERGETIEVQPIRVHLDGPPCYERPRQIDLPPGMGPGLWEYVPIMTWRNEIGRTASVRNSSILFEVRDEEGRLVIVSPREKK